MAPIASTALETDAADPWPAVAQAADAWLAAQGIARRDAVVLVPFAALLPPARVAFGARGGWQPRIETPLTLADALGPPAAATGGVPSGDPVLDRLHAAALLRQLPWGAERERSDRRGFAQLVDAFASAAASWRDAALERAPAERGGFFDGARARLPAAAGPGAVEAALLRASLEWAAGGVQGPTDPLFTLRPGAWIVLRIGGASALAEALPAATGRPGLVIDVDAAEPPPSVPQRRVCDDLEAEAQATAAAVVEAVDAGHVPVGLVVLDRVLVRRVRALLERAQVPVVDETGWALSTTHAAAGVMALLRAASPSAGPDARLAWLKTWPPAQHAAAAQRALEAAWRQPREPDGDAAALWAEAQAALQPFTSRRERSLAAWLAALHEHLAAHGTLDRLRTDAAGRPLLEALRLDRMDAAWRDAADATRLDLSGFTAWVDATLESATFVPSPAPGAEVVLTPLSRAIGRPFATVVVPGCDEKNLGSTAAVGGLIGDALATELGLDGALQRRQRQQLALRQLLRVPRLVLLRRRQGDEPLAPSPEVEAWALRRRWPAEQVWQPPQRSVPAQPVARPAPSAPAQLPATLSPSAIERLRECPYRFFARSVLRLAEPEELETELAKRDYGNWLHGVLHRFHRDRVEGTDDAAALAQAADAETAERRIDAADLLPFRASFERFAPAYLAWLAGREAAGWRWQAGEVDRRAEPAALAPLRVAGRLDRLDRGADGGLQVIDYKTGSVVSLKQRVADPLEDTQLPVYVLMEPAARRAIYLALDDEKAPLEIEHPDVPATAATMATQLGAEFARLRAGAAMPALGEPPACDRCESRGLCRRDHWAVR